VKRAQDKEKLKDYEKLMLQNEQLIEFKTRCGTGTVRADMSGYVSSRVF